MSKTHSGMTRPDWAIDQVTRASGLVEDIYKHGIGHPNVEWVAVNDHEGYMALGIHGCDGCCTPRKEDNSVRED